MSFRLRLQYKGEVFNGFITFWKRKFRLSLSNSEDRRLVHSIKTHLYLALTMRETVERWQIAFLLSSIEQVCKHIKREINVNQRTTISTLHKSQLIQYMGTCVEKDQYSPITTQSIELTLYFNTRLKNLTKSAKWERSLNKFGRL